MMRFLVGLAIGMAAIAALAALFRSMTLQVGENEGVVFVRRGVVVRVYQRAGLHFVAWRLIPKLRERRISLRRDFIHIEALTIQGPRGARVVDLWLEFRVIDILRFVALSERDCRGFAEAVEHTVRQTVLAAPTRQVWPPDHAVASAQVERKLRDLATLWGLLIERVFVHHGTPPSTSMGSLITSVATITLFASASNLQVAGCG